MDCPRKDDAESSSHHRRKLANLNAELAFLPRGETECVFIEPHLRPFVGRIEVAVEPGLRKEVEMRTDLGIEKSR